MSEKLPGDLSGLGDRGQIVVGFSGGADSTALAHWLAGQVSRERILLAHVNHRLRGEESDRDEAAARAFALEQGLRFAVSRVDVRALAETRGMGLEACGRAVRYEFFHSLAPGEEDRILTAHTADDNAETVLLHLCRGTGLSGLCGIPARRGKILRPFLTVTREQIEAYCREHGLSYVTDSTNLEPDHTRNRLRLQVMPILRELNPRFSESVGKTARLLQRDREYLEEEGNRLLDGAKRPYGLDAEVLRNAPCALRPAVLKLWLTSEGCRDLEKKHLDLAEDCLLRGGAVPLPGERLLRCSGGLLTLEGPGEAAEYAFSVGPGEWPLPGGRWLVLEKKELTGEGYAQKIHNLDFKSALDYDIMIGKLTARTRREGDRFSPAGRGLSKPLRQVLREAGIPAGKRGEILLLECAGEIAFCEGAGVSEKFRITENTVTALLVTVKGNQETEREG